MKFNNKDINKIYIGDTLVNRINDGDFQYMPKHDYASDYLTFEALESGTFTLTINSGVTTGDVVSVSYSLDNGNTWTTTNNVQGQEVVITTPTVNSGDEVLWKGNANKMGKSITTANTSIFSSTANFNARGNVMSLLYGDEFKGEVNLTGRNYCFSCLFSDNEKLINAENLSLPATTLADYCYNQMFDGCTSLTTAPVLPAITLAAQCYGGMFQGCTSLTTAPELPATTLAERCYRQMFMSCTSLSTAPELPATTLVGNCYNGMFRTCTNLSYIKCLATDISASSCTSNWLYGVASSGTFVKASSMNDWPTGTSGIPEGWTIENE